MSGEQFLHLGNHKFLEGSAVSLIVMEGVLGIGMVGCSCGGCFRRYGDPRIAIFPEGRDFAPQGLRDCPRA